MRRFLFAIVIASAAAPAGAGAQYDGDVHTAGVGARVRVGVLDRVPLSLLASPTRRVKGIVRAVAPDTLYLAPTDTVGTVALPRARIRGIEMSEGRSRWKSARDVGTVSAIILAAVLASEEMQPDRRFGSDRKAAAAGLGIGFSLGALAGALWPWERWKEAWLPE